MPPPPPMSNKVKLESKHRQAYQVNDMFIIGVYCEHVKEFTHVLLPSTR